MAIPHRATWIVVVLVLASSVWSDEATVDLPWKSNTPVVTVTQQLYQKSPKPGAAAMVSAFYAGPTLERMEVHAYEVIDDVPSEPKARWSTDNGRSWSSFAPLPATLSYPKGVEVWQGSGPRFYDPETNVLLDMWLRQIRVDRLYHCFTYCRLSHDHGKTWTEPEQLCYEDGSPFDPNEPLDPDFINHNEAYFGSNILRHSNGTLIHAVAHANAPDDPDNNKRSWRMGSLCFIGKWNAQSKNYQWTPGKRVTISPDVSSRGLMEPEVAELSDGRVLVVWRGADAPKTAGRKWFSISTDGGLTLSAVKEWKYDDGSRFYSPSSFHRMIRHSKTGKLYWFGNIVAAPPRGDRPRYPLVIAEVDETIPALKRHTVTAIDDRQPGQPELIQFSNFSLLENRETHEFELFLCPYGEEPESKFTANCYRYICTLVK